MRRSGFSRSIRGKARSGAPGNKRNRIFAEQGDSILKTKKGKSESTRRVKAHRSAKTARTFGEKTGAAARRDGVAAFGKAAAAARRKRRTAADYSGEALGRPPVTGVLSLARSGAGFVSPETGGRDVFVPASAVGPALPGDLVEVRFAEGDEGAARVARVVRRGARDVVCTLRRVGRHVTAVPMTPFGGRTFHIADPGCARDGDRVVVRFSSWTNPVFNPEGEIVAVIGPENTPSLDTRTGSGTRGSAGRPGFSRGSGTARRPARRPRDHDRSRKRPRLRRRAVAGKRRAGARSTRSPHRGRVALRAAWNRAGR